jgi:hypothetical protein
VFDLDGPASALSAPTHLLIWRFTLQKHGCLTLFRLKSRILPSSCARGEVIGMTGASGNGPWPIAIGKVWRYCLSFLNGCPSVGISGRNGNASGFTAIISGLANVIACACKPSLSAKQKIKKGDIGKNLAGGGPFALIIRHSPSAVASKVPIFLPSFCILIAPLALARRGRASFVFSLCVLDLSVSINSRHH